jgi:hypothetical protein
LRNPYPQLLLIAGAAAISLFTASAILIGETHTDAMVRLAVGLTSLILATLIVHAILAELGRRRIERKVDALTRAALTREHHAARRFDQLERAMKCDRMFLRDVLKDLGLKMDAVGELERVRFEVLKDFNDTGGNPIIR